MYRNKHLLVTLCLLLLITFLNGQIKGRLSLSEDQETYEFYITPDFDQAPPLSTTNSGQISFVAPVGGLEIVNFQSVTGKWNGVDIAVIESPIENPGFAYVSIPLGSPMQDITYQAGVEILLFTFENGMACLGSLDVVDNASDPFLPPNSVSVNIGNLFTILGLGPRNVYEGTDICCVSCPGEEEEMVEMETEEMPVDTTDTTEIVDSTNIEEPIDNNTEVIDSTSTTEEPIEEPGATPPNSLGTPCSNNSTISHIDISLSATGTPPYHAVWTNTNSGITDSMEIAEINGPYRLIENAAPGGYEITLTDAIGRTLNLYEEIADNRYFLNPTLTVTDATCGGTGTGVMRVAFPAGDTGTYEYEWSNGINNAAEISDLSPDTYEVTITDGNGCSVVQKATVALEGGINADIGLADISCKGKNDGHITVNVPNATNLSYQWESDNGLTSTESSLDNLPPGNYAVTISDPSGLCDQVKTVQIVEPEELTINARMTETDLCEVVEEGTLLIDGVLNGQGTLRYALNDEEFTTSNRFRVNTGETYTLIAKDELGCTSSTTIDVPNSSGLSLEVPERLILELGDEMELELDYSASSDVTFDWEDNPTLSCTDCPNPTINPTQTTTYTLILSDDNGCSKDATIIVFLSKTDKIYTPTAFSPNADGINDYFNIFSGSNVESVNSLQVFNRWGARVFQSTIGYTSNVNELGWDGGYNGQLAEAGVYVYFAEVLLVDGSLEILKGEVSLVR